jgi:hypothetical protein
VTLIVRVLAPRGARFEFPAGPDTAHTEGTYPVELIGKRAMAMHGDTAIAGYRLAAWDVGTQALHMPDITVTIGSRTQHVALSEISIFVRSVLPADTALRKPKPARPLITLIAFNWRSWLIALLGLLLALLGLWLWWRYRNRAAAPMDPYERAKAEFARVASQFPPDRNPDQHYAAMVDVMRDYLAARVTGVRRSYTTRELLASMQLVSAAEQALPGLLERADLVKFARAAISSDEASAAGAAARSIADQVEVRIVAAERAEKAEKAESAEPKLERAA